MVCELTEAVGHQALHVLSGEHSLHEGSGEPAGRPAVQDPRQGALRGGEARWLHQENEVHVVVDHREKHDGSAGLGRERSQHTAPPFLTRKGRLSTTRGPGEVYDFHGRGG